MTAASLPGLATHLAAPAPIRMPGWSVCGLRLGPCDDRLTTAAVRVDCQRCLRVMRARRKRDFVGTYPCFFCARKVRVYGWLPDAVLCAACMRDRDEQERAMVGTHEDE